MLIALANREERRARPVYCGTILKGLARRRFSNIRGALWRTRS
jgi:hypothetical protein